MNEYKVSKIQYSTQVASTPLLEPRKQVVITFSGTITGGQQTKSVFIPYEQQQYFTNAMYSVSGSLVDLYKPWTRAPRVIYLTTETSSPTPRVYLYKNISISGITLEARIMNVNNTTFTLSGIYNINIVVFILGANAQY